ncbi:MAG: ABC transporter ATP-binding protein [Lentisphaeria bacterium]|nr:ABC transporter ATP-binding protein [Lentisphaeria bacterium]
MDQPVTNANTENDILLSVRGLRTEFHLEEGVARAVRGVSFDIPRGTTVGLVGESGCGKSVTAYSILRLIPQPPGRIVAGEILFDGRDLLQLSNKEMEAVRGNGISMVFQEPMSSLNPVFTVGNQIMEGVLRHRDVEKAESRDIAIDMLRRVGIPSPEQRVDEYPHQLSGGMRQRVVIAMALVCKPDLVIADEPTTALDVTIQAQILDLLAELQHDMGMSVLLITHDLGVVAEVTKQVAVMYAGKIVETASTEELFANPLHPYTKGLFRSIPKLGVRRRRLDVIGGTVPSAMAQPPGCAFHPRCPVATEVCREHIPELKPVCDGHCAACHLL